ncbi:MAG: hypothetical protein L0Z53_17070 [Acidobacteriales bacterium]|nr:hypothetical protein [Terriglobales bacterium]
MPSDSCMVSRQKPRSDGFPEEFTVQHIGVTGANALSDLPPAEIVKHLREHPETATALISESYDKRYSPSSFIMEDGDGFRVGWVTGNAKYECVLEFSDLADAATDYLLFSLGRGRWTPGK